MAGASLFALIDKIAAALDDVALMTKVAAKKTAGVLGDDLALNAQQVSGVNAERELPVVWAVAKGSALNKLILVPAALLISAFISWLITPLLMLGGAFLCYEGVEKIAHSLLHSSDDPVEQSSINVAQSGSEPNATPSLIEKQIQAPVESEPEKIKGAIRTDFILSAEIIVIALGTVQQTTLSNQIIVVSLIALVMTIGVYGLVAAIVKLDDIGLYLIKNNAADKKNTLAKLLTSTGLMLVNFAPRLMKSLTIIGTIAMFLVGGSILVHGIPFVHHMIEASIESVKSWSYIGGLAASLTPLLLEALVGMLIGFLVYLSVTLIQKLFVKV